ncbi:MAG: YebC/PmpR family DNA-binding transcriptional regulator [Clostridia bacterium]|jgi:YebC/PmpR family DNA-binding regulatory protein|nr:YebC/PmpR family DNA-binding transcriptional regulator [Clostridia bacterium]
MSGHSKWHNIQAKKGKADAQRGAVFTKIGREIAIAVREGGANPDSNGKLRDIIAKAKANNMPNDNIQRSIKKASGELSNVVYEEITYEGYAPGGVAVIVDTISDNRNRTASDIRHCFAKYGGNMGTTGSVGFMFDTRGVLVVEKAPDADEDEMMMTALDAGAEDVKVDEDVFEIYTDPNEFSKVREALEKQGLTFLSADVQKIPQNTVAVTDPDTIEKIQKMLDLLEESDDVQNVYHNADLPEEDEDED